MSQTKLAANDEVRAPLMAPRPGTTLAAFVIGLPLAAAVLGAVLFGPLHEVVPQQYVKSRAEWAAVVFFCCAVGTLAGKTLQNAVERRACRTAVLPPWDRKPVPVAEAPDLLAALSRLPRSLQCTY